MKVICENLPSNRKECVATIGVFDGIHRGHQLILKKVKEEAAKKNLSSLLITFDIPPQLILKKTFLGCLTDFQDKKSIIKTLGMDYLWFLKTGDSLLKLSGEEFIAYVLKYFNIRKFIVGEDFRFGYKGETHVIHFKTLAKKYKFEVKILKKKRGRGEIISSSLIRRLIKEGQFQKTKELLGREYVIKGRVCKGIGYGSKLGYPTANIRSFGYVLPASGVYAALVYIDKKSYLSAVNIGVKPTIVKSGEKVLEAHIINFRKNLLEKTVKVSFLKKIREEKRFSSPDELRKTISKDISYISANYPIS
jgi:riboflavin kinase/FMN adenylyltransferase